MKGPEGPAENRKKRQSTTLADIESCLQKIKVSSAMGCWRLTVETLSIKTCFCLFRPKLPLQQSLLHVLPIVR